MNTIHKTIISLAATTAMSQAAISIVGIPIFDVSSGSSVTLSSFAAGIGNKLVVTSGSEDGGVAGITYGGVALTLAVSSSEAPTYASIWYLDGAAVANGDIVVLYETGGLGAYTHGISAISISGATIGVFDTAGANGTSSGSLNTGVGSLVVGSFATNASASPILAGNASTEIFSGTNIVGTGGTNAASAYFTSGSATEDFGFTDGSTSRPLAVAVSFVAVPEPSSSALLGLGSFALILRRRK